MSRQNTRQLAKEKKENIKTKTIGLITTNENESR